MRLLLLVVAWHYQLAYLLAERSPQERDDLRAGAVIARRKGCLVHARGHAVHVAPRHRFIRPFGHIGERQVEHPRAREALTLRLSAAVNHGRSLRAGADAVCAEGRLRQTGDDAGACRPTDRLGIVRALVHIRERHPVIHHGGTRRAPEEGHDLGAGAGLVRCKEAVTNAAGDAVLRRPLDGLVVIGVVGYVVEEVENAVVLHEGRLDLHLARRHGEGVFAAALVDELQIIAVLVGDGNGFQHIAAVRLYRNRYGAARRGVLRADSHRAVVCLIWNADRIAGGTATPASTIVAPLCRDGQVFGGHGGGDFRVPAHKRVAGLGGGFGCGDVRAVVLRNGCDCAAAVGVKGDGVLVDPPLRLDGYILGGHGGRELRLPAHEGVAGFGGSCEGGDGRAVLLRDGCNRAAAVGVEGDGVRIRRPLGCQGHVLRHSGVEVILRVVQIPVRELITLSAGYIRLNSFLARLDDLLGIDPVQLPVLIGHGDRRAVGVGDVGGHAEGAGGLDGLAAELCVQGEEYTILVSCFCLESRNGYYGEWMDLMVSYLRTY